MRELGRVIRAYYHDRHTQWDTIIKRFVDTVNNTQHFSTGEAPVELYPEIQGEMQIDERIIPETYRAKDRRETIEEIRRHLKKKATERKKQTDKHGEAKQFVNGDMVWVRLHRRSDASRRVTRKIHLVYQGPYKIKEIIRKNAYLIEDLDGQTIGTYNSRQLRPHREPKLKQYREHERGETIEREPVRRTETIKINEEPKIHNGPSEKNSRDKLKEKNLSRDKGKEDEKHRSKKKNKNRRENEDLRRIEVVKLRPIESLRYKHLRENTRKSDEASIEIKEEIASNEERENTKCYALEKYDERLTEINGEPCAYNYRECKARKVGTEDEFQRGKSRKAITVQSWFTCVQPSRVTSERTNDIISSQAKKKTNEEVTRKNRLTDDHRGNNKEKSGDRQYPAATKRKRERPRVSSAEDSERATHEKKTKRRRTNGNNRPLILAYDQRKGLREQIRWKDIR